MDRTSDHGSLGVCRQDTRAPYRQISTEWIEHTQTLDILVFANTYSGDGETNSSDFPSWVINWDLPTSPIWARALPCRFKIIPYDEPKRSGLWKWLDNLYFHGRGDRARCLEKYEGATPGTQPLWAFHNHGKSLAVAGVVLTQITSHFTPPQPIRDLFSLYYDASVGMSRDQYMSSTGPCGAFLDRARGGPEGPEFFLWLQRRLAAGREKLAASWREDSLDSFMSKIALHGFPDESHEKEWGVDWMLGEKDLCAAASQTRRNLRNERLSLVLCETNSACPGSLAYAARGAQKGDTVALVSGVSYPLVLRPTGDKRSRFRLIGPIFLPGVMDGELKDLLKPEVFDEMVLV
ncbi:hypothetical protein KVR01_000458 [Diaporthe batatas]|uniref:uncharacterized protein n=1 Tax=Diaporthe batatas TaxID=748121 RepID=UPI001D03F792|nr:uncharacterized protein KVR01_000458 [Diaporthe batatas]KAG8169713.1 hypothetical protein KVR01_000458 [Diaporthe batatas]